MGPCIGQETVCGPFAVPVAASATVAQGANTERDNDTGHRRRGVDALGKHGDEAEDTVMAVELELDQLA
ncbi:MAG TPA: hypothetical protein VGS27_15080 [Candidatus Sulfotelmatobacter sp.]|nr:hypothetical protein [Candidatus Sulfotelmatobacter sp.]